MFRILCGITKNISPSKALILRLGQQSNMSTSLLCRSSTRKPRADGIKITDINIHDLAKGDKEFTRNFLTSLSALNKGKPESSSLPKLDGEDQTVSSGDAAAPASSGPILDMDGNPIVPIEIDGWSQSYEEGDPTVQKPNTVDIGNDDEYKQEMSLKVPETRDASFEYKGIKITLPKKASKDVGTYRFRRDASDLESVADDIRVAKFDKK